MRVIEHDMTEELCIRLLGWKWMSFVGIPTRDTECYPNKCRVRQFFSPTQLKDKHWNEFLSENEGHKAIGTEPMHAAYRTFARPPRFIILVDD
jgi:hypothetical protein